MFDSNPEEHYLKKGDPNKPTYYICRRVSDTLGLLSKYRVVMGHVRYALSNGWFPVVDMQNYSNSYLAPEKLGKENSWEYYFEQPVRIGLEEAYNGENVILSSNDVTPSPGHTMKFLENKGRNLMEWQMLIKLGFMKIKPELMQEISEIREKLFPPEERILGVHLRGTDFFVRKNKGRPIPPPTEFASITVNAKLREWKCQKFFLATEDKTIADTFKENFGEECITFDQEYVTFNPKRDKATSVCRINRPNDHYLQGKEYLTQMVLLSTCNSFVGARCSGTTFVAMMGENFARTYYFNLGRYGMITLD